MEVTTSDAGTIATGGAIIDGTDDNGTDGDGTHGDGEDGRDAMIGGEGETISGDGATTTALCGYLHPAPKRHEPFFRNSKQNPNSAGGAT